MGDPARRQATYQDVIDAPPNMIAQIIGGVLDVQPRPRLAHQSVAWTLSSELEGPFRRGRGGPGGWLFLSAPELHFGDDVLVPDMVGYRRERLAVVPDAAFLTLASDWVCEILSPATARRDRIDELAIYARAEVGHAWLVDPEARTLEAFRREGAAWLHIGAHADDAKARIEPFDAIELDLAALWADLA